MGNTDSMVLQHQGALKNAVVNVEAQLTAYSIIKIRKIVKNNFEDEEGFIPQSIKRNAEIELLLVLISFYGVIMLIEGSKRSKELLKETQLPSVFNLNDRVKQYIDNISKKVSTSHIDTVSSDLYKTAREAALEGLSRDQIVARIVEKYNNEISETRAKTIARTETNRAFTRSQYEADIQFIQQNELEGRVYKKWITRSDNPCEFCLELENSGYILFDEPFREIGDTISIGTGKNKKTLEIAFEDLDAGNAHPNCNCAYKLIIK